ncbi:MAG TPA: cyclic nucleotide-binding domain-containing protein [Acidimicrobiales bacterium]|nr:cyclic nucleotide-binding domain-containing protein [Acidimicrobiales bacterium]
MRVTSSVTSISWIPSEAVAGGTRVPFDVGVAHYDAPPPDAIEDLVALRDADRFRFANRLSAWIEVDGDRISDAGYDGGGMIGSTTVRLGPVSHRFEAVPFPDIQTAPEWGDGWVRFTQTAGGRTGMPAPRRVTRPPFVQWQAPLAWTRLTLTLFADGRAEGEMTEASRFPRHWVYGDDGGLTGKSGVIDFKEWYRKGWGKETPWGNEDSKAFVTVAEIALERGLSAQLMHGAAKPRLSRVKAGTTLISQGDAGTDVYLVLDGVVRVDVDGEPLAEYGPGAMLGERAFLEGGRRTSSLVAVTNCKFAAVAAESLDRGELTELSEGHRREETTD